MFERRWFHLLSLIALCSLAYIPGQWTIPPIDRDEARFAQATRQMLESGDYVTIRFQDELRNKKPAGIHWLQAASVALLSNASSSDIWPYRVPSWIGATLSVCLLYLLFAGSVGARPAWIAAMMLGSSMLLIVEAHLATTDAVLLLTCMVGFGTLGSIYIDAPDHRTWGRAVTLWIAIGLGVLIKGPLIAFFVGLTLVTLTIADRSARLIRRIHPVIGVPIAMAIVVPWFIMVQRATDGAFMRDAFTQDLWAKIVSGQESHGFPPLFYLVLIPVTFIPGSLFAARAVIEGWRERRESTLIRFCLAWLIPAWIVLELVPTKLPHYVLPLYPALAILVAVSVTRSKFKIGPGDKVGMVIWVAVPAAALVILYKIATGYGSHGLAVLIGLIAMIGFVLASRAALLKRPDRAMLMSAAFTAVSMAIAFHLFIPTLGFWPSQSAHNAIQSLRTDAPDLTVVSVGYHEPSLVFLCGTETQLVGAKKAAEIMDTSASPVAVLVTRGDRQAAFVEAAAERGLVLDEPVQVTPDTTANLVKGGWVLLEMYTKKIDAAPS